MAFGQMAFGQINRNHTCQKYDLKLHQRTFQSNALWILLLARQMPNKVIIVISPFFQLVGDTFMIQEYGQFEKNWDFFKNMNHRRKIR
jgi:hypothetical protein